MCSKKINNYDQSLCNNCKIREKTELHTCPFKVEIDDDIESVCDCCEECQDQCADDV